jgi:hypothetical protein
MVLLRGFELGYGNWKGLTWFLALPLIAFLGLSLLICKMEQKSSLKGKLRTWCLESFITGPGAWWIWEPSTNIPVVSLWGKWTASTGFSGAIQGPWAYPNSSLQAHIPPFSEEIPKGWPSHSSQPAHHADTLISHKSGKGLLDNNTDNNRTYLQMSHFILLKGTRPWKSHSPRAKSQTQGTSLALIW